MASMSSQLRAGMLGLALGLSTFIGAAVAQTAYEPFSGYPANGPISGKNGGTGWAGPWTGFADNVVAPGLVYPGLATAGLALGPTPGSASTRLLATTVVGTAGRSLVLSALIRSDVAGTPATQATLGNTSGGTFIIGDLPQSDANAGKWGFQTSAGRFYSNVPVAANATTYLVAEIDFNVSGNNDRIRLWVNPPANSWFTVSPAIDDSTSDVPQFSGVFWQTQQGQRVDEIRVQSSTTACAPPPNTTMVAWYPFDEASGPTALNYATANDGAWVNGPSPVAGMVGRALRFDGVNDYVESPSSLVTNFGPAGTAATGSGGWSTSQGGFSLDVWARLGSPSLGSQVMIIADKRDGNPPAIKGYSFFVFNNQIGLQLADGLNERVQQLLLQRLDAQPLRRQLASPHGDGEADERHGHPLLSQRRTRRDREPPGPHRLAGQQQSLADRHADGGIAAVRLRSGRPGQLPDLQPRAGAV